MRPSAICSDWPRAGGERPRPANGVAALVVTVALMILGGPSEAPGQVRMTQPEALATVFGDTSRMERRTAYLDSAQIARASELAGGSVPVNVSVVTYYTGTHRDGGPAVAYFDAHRVRTKPEVLMIVVGPNEEVRRVEVLKFTEPQEYFPPDGWLEQFPGRVLDEALSTHGEIAGITGATLTARAVTRAVRRTLALHRVIDPLGAGR